MNVSPEKSPPPFYRFCPTDKELINHFLRLKINGHQEKVKIIREVNIYSKEPWDLPGLSEIKSNPNEWFFFCHVSRKSQNGKRLNRATEAGYWKATGKDRMIKVSKRGIVIGKKKTLVFYMGRAPRGERTHWLIHEYSATTQELDGTHPGQSPFVICRLFKKEDEDDGSSNDIDVDHGFVSPTSNVRASPEDPPLEPVTPLLTAQPDVQPSSNNGCAIGDFERMGVDHLACSNLQATNNYIGHSEYKTPNLVLEEDFKFLDNLIVEPNEFSAEDFGCNGESIAQDFVLNVCVKENGDFSVGGLYAENNQSQLHMAPQVYGPTYSYPTEVFNDENGENVVLRSNIPDVNVSSSVPVEDYVNNLVKEASYCSNINTALVGTGSDDDFGTGIKIRTHKMPTIASGPSIKNQGTAPRRIRLQRKLQGPRDVSSSEERREGEQAVIEVQEALETHNLNACDVSANDGMTKSAIGEEADQDFSLNVKDSSLFRKAYEGFTHVALYMPKVLVFLGFGVGVISFREIPNLLKLCMKNLSGYCE